MTSQEPLFLSADAAKLLSWARSQPDHRDSFSRVETDPVKQERHVIGPRGDYYDDGYKRYPMRLYQGWYYCGQWCFRQVSENLGWDDERHSAAFLELKRNGYARELGWFIYEATERGWELEVECPEVVAVR